MRRPLAALSLVLAAASLAAPVAAQWVRPEGSNRSTVTRQVDRPPPMLGGLDLNAYCNRRGYYAARLEHSTWICISENGRIDIDLDDACRWAFGPDARARRMSDSPLSWICYGEVAPAAPTAPAVDPMRPGMDRDYETPAAPPGANGASGTPAPPGAPPPSGPPIFGTPPGPVPAAPTAAAAPEPAPTGLVARVLSPWTSLPFYARAVIAGLGALVLGLLLGGMLRRKPGRED